MWIVLGRFREQAAPVAITDITRFGANEPRDRPTLGELAHVELDHLPRRAIEKLRQRHRHLVLAHAFRSYEQERAIGLFRSDLESKLRDAHNAGDVSSRALLTRHCRIEEIFQTIQTSCRILIHHFQRESRGLGQGFGYTIASEAIVSGERGLGRCLIKQVKRFVGKASRLEITLGHLDDHLDNLFVDVHTVIRLKRASSLQQNPAGFFAGRLFDRDGAEASSERFVARDIFVVFGKRRRSNAGYFAFRQRRLQ